jgi:single-stranded DNA-binding protein
MTMEQDVDRPGSEYAAENVVSPERCAQRCAESAACASYTAVSDTFVYRCLWVKVLAFGGAAEPLKDLKKGAPVYVSGPLTYDRWESAQGPRHAPVVRVTDRSGEVQAAPMPGGQFARVMLSGVLAKDAALNRGEDDQRSSARLWVQARTGHAVVVQGPLVEHISERLKAGHGVHLEGRLELHRWQDGAGKPHERVTVVVGGPDTQIRVDRTPLALPGLEPKPVVPSVTLDPPAPIEERGRPDRTRR